MVITVSPQQVSRAGLPRDGSKYSMPTSLLDPVLPNGIQEIHAHFYYMYNTEENK